MFWRKKTPPALPPERGPIDWTALAREIKATKWTQQGVLSRSLRTPQPVATDGRGNALAMDDSLSDVKARLSSNMGGGIPEAQMEWYASFSFIGYQACALLSQHWLINKVCLMPARDAVRVGWELTVNDGSEIAPDVLDKIKAADDRLKVVKNMVEFVHQGRVFGVRVAMFVVDSTDPEYFYKPYNPDGITPGSYRGLTQIDPYWMAPLLDTDASADPASQHFYEPTWWRVGSRTVHRSHLVVYRASEVPDILKPTYLYGGVPVTQQIAERVYAAERTANEAPLLALTKRLNVLKTDMLEAVKDPAQAEARLAVFTQFRDNFGALLIDKEDEAFEQTDTTLGDFDALLMTQYQLVAAAGGVPATKLLGTTPKGFNATGEYEEASYHETLESIQTHDLTPLLAGHYERLIRSEIAPTSPFEVCVKWHELDALTSKEQAEINNLKAQTAATLAGMGAIDGTDERDRLIADPDSGYSGMSNEPPEEPDPDMMDIANGPASSPANGI